MTKPIKNAQHPIWRAVKSCLVLVLISGMAVAGWTGWKVYANAAKITGESNPITLLSQVFNPVDLKSIDGTTTILLAGYSVDDANHGGATLTDSIMLLQFNKKTGKARMVSIPRDLYVSIPGYGYSKINAAYEYGEEANFSEAGYSAGGMGLLEKTVQNITGTSIQYYALIDYTAFKSAVDAVGGITITITSDDSRGIYDANIGIKLPNGEAVLDGATALKLARSRGSTIAYGLSSDFDRTKYQREMLLALKDKASSSSILSNPFKIGQLADSLGDNVKTDMSIAEIESLYDATKNIDVAAVEQVSLDSVNGLNLLTDYITGEGQQALIPVAGFEDYQDIKNIFWSLAE